MIWLLSAVNVGFLLVLVMVLFGGWRLFVAWRDVRRERREEAERGGPGPR